MGRLFSFADLLHLLFSGPQTLTFGHLAVANGRAMSNHKSESAQTFERKPASLHPTPRGAGR